MSENKWNFTFPESFLKVMEELNKVQLSTSALAMSQAWKAAVPDYNFIGVASVLKKYAVDLSELTDANKQNHATEDKNWYLTLRGLFRNHTEQKSMRERFTPTQELCLILTIRDPERQARVYDEVTQGLDAIISGTAILRFLAMFLLWCSMRAAEKKVCQA